MKIQTQTWCFRVVAIGLLALSGGVSAQADFSSTVLSKNPIGYWRFNETNLVPVMAVATNYGNAGAAGNGSYRNSATTVSGPIAGSPGDTAASFDGLSQMVEVPYDAALNPASALSVEAWVKPSEIDLVNNSWARGIVSTFGGNAQGGGYKLMYNAGNSTTPDVFKFTLWTGSTGTETYSTNGLISPNLGTGPTILATNNGPWFHVVGTWNSSDKIPHLYVNGVEMTNYFNGEPPVNYIPTTGPLRIGATDTDPTDPVGAGMHPGPIAHVAVYDTQLTLAQIQTHYQAVTSASSNYSGTVLNDNPTGYWKLNETGFPAMPVAINQGTKGSAINGTYCFASTPGVAGPLPPNYGGFAATNTAAYVTNSTTGIGNGGFVLFPPIRNTTDQTNLTIVALIKRNGAQMQNANIFGRRINNYEKGQFGFVSSSANNNLGYNWDDNANQYNFVSGLIPPDGVWTLAAWVVTPTNCIIYMDTGSGLRAATNTTPNDITVGGATCLCKAVFCGTTGGNYQGRRYNGLVDELAVWTNSLTQADILDLREALIGSGLFIVQQSPAIRPVMLGGNAAFYATLAGSTNYMPFSYQLLKNGIAVGSPGSGSLFYTNVQASDLASGFRIAALTNGTAALTSSVVNLQRWTLPGTYSGLVESYHPTAYYRFSENSLGTVYELAQCLDGVTGGLLSPAAGPVATDGADYGFEAQNTAFNFNSAGASPLAGGYVNCSGPGIIFNNGSIVTTTITGWIYPTASQIAYSGIYYARMTDYAALNFGPSGGYELGVSWNGNYPTHTLVYTYPNTWNFIAMVVTNTSATFYCYSVANGWQSNTIYGSFPVRNLTGGTGTAIGTDPNTSLNRGIKGSIDEVAVFNQYMTWDDVQKLAYAGTQVHVAIQPAAGNNYTVGWSWGTLQWADSVTGPWSDVPGAAATSFSTSATNSQKFFRATY